MTTLLDPVDPQAALPEFLRRRQPTYAQAPQGMLSQAAYQAAGPFPSYNPKPMTIAPPLAPAPSATPGQTGSDGGGAAAGLGGLLGLAAQNPSGVASLYNGAKNLLGGGGFMEGLTGLSAFTPAQVASGAGGLLSNSAVQASLLADHAALPAGVTAALEGGAPAAAAAAPAASGAAPAAAGSVPWGTLAGGAAALGGGLLAYQGISRGNEGQAALGGGLAAAGAGSLAGLSGLAALGPVGLIGAGVGALAASLTNTDEFGNKAFSNYWKGVEQGRNVGESDPTELAQGFINLYRTNKYEFPGQAKYGRTGNEDFLYDMTQQINSAVNSGAVPKDATAGQIYSQVVQPWMAQMGGGTKDDKTAAVQDFMMTDLINNYMQGKPISNAQVKNDSKFKIVSDRPVYPGAQAASTPTTAYAPPSYYGGLLGAM